MTGRGRPCKAKSPDTKCAKGKTKPEEVKQVFLPRCPRKGLTEERHNVTTEEQKPKEQKLKEQKPKEQKQTNHTEEKPPVQTTQKDRTTEHFTEDIDKQQRASTDKTKAPVQGTKVKNCAGRDKTTSAEEIKMQPKTAKDTAKATKAKTCGGKAKSVVEFDEGTTKTQPQTPNDSAQIVKPKTRPGKVKPPQQFVEETTNMQPETLKHTTMACVPQNGREDKAAVDSILYTTLEKLKIKMNDRSEASKVVNEIIENITKHLKQNTQCFKEVGEPLRTGSYYENLKISNPDEFDVMLPIPVERVTIKPFGENGAFYSVELKRGKSPLQKFQESTNLSASKMLQEFREEVKKSVKGFTEWSVTKKKKGCPAVTLITKVQSSTISLDVVLSLMVKSSWPTFTNEGLKIEGWLGTKVKQEHKRKPYYLVPKYEGRGTVENDGVLAKDIWRVSFSHVEKAILKNHGSEKTCCEKGGVRCCRKDCLKLLKHLLSRLKEMDPSYDKFCSYHAKTTLLHACCSRTKDSEWSASNLNHCFQLLLNDFVAHLESGVLNNFFIPSQNLLSGPGKIRCTKLARSIREECEKGFPIFM